jgi:hypothetical protein
MEEKLIAGLKQEYQDRVEMMYELYAHKGILIRKLDLHTKKWSYRMHSRKPLSLR